MTIHKGQSGNPLVCFWCANPNEICADSVVHDLEEVKCHCPCQPECTLTSCQPKSTKATRAASPTLCPTCKIPVPCYH